MFYSYVITNNTPNITLLFTEIAHPPVSVSSNHPKWDEVNDLRSAGILDSTSDQAILDILAPKSITESVSAVSDWVSGRVSTNVYGVTLDGKQITGDIASGLLKALGTDAGDDHVLAIARFLEKASKNENLPKADKLYRWILAEGLTLASDGDFIGYKSVDKVDADRFDSKFGTNLTLPNGDVTTASQILADRGAVGASSRAGGGIVDGVEFPGYVPNYVGAVVEMPRDKVDSNGQVECSVGLHVGTYDYASNFIYGGDLLLVKVNPADVVAVPDYDFSKLRACRYKVIAKDVAEKLDSTLYIEDQFAPIVSDDEFSSKSSAEISDISRNIVSELLDRIRATG